jgi:hypothetical protein
MQVARGSGELCRDDMQFLVFVDVQQVPDDGEGVRGRILALGDRAATCR